MQSLAREAVNEHAVVQKVTWRLIPFLFVLYVIAYLDRVNVSFAKLQMNADLGFSEKMYGFGAGIFFIGYFLFEIPSNLILERVGARRWIARIMVSWGIIAMAMMFTNLFANKALPFYTLRFLLGIAEAGFFPGIILYLTYWFTARERARMVAWFMTANPIAFVLGGPISGWLLKLNVGGLRGWQWLFLVEALPAVLLAGVVLVYLPDGPRKARWLSPNEQETIAARVDAERRHKAQHGTVTLRSALANPRVWGLSALYITMTLGMYGFSFWLPQIIKTLFGLTDQQSVRVGVLTAIPYCVTAVVMVLAGHHSDKTGERRWHVAGAALIAVVSLTASAYLGASRNAPWPTLLCLSAAGAAMWSMLGPFWSLPTAFLGGTAAAAGLAFINSVGNLGGFVGPYMMGYIKDVTHGFKGGLLTLATSMLFAAVLALCLRTEPVARPPLDDLRR